MTFNGVSPGTATNWSATSIVVSVPAGATTGNVVVTVGGVSSGGRLFTVTPPPSISYVTPTTANPGPQVTVQGSGFGSPQGTGAEWLGTAYGTVVSWTDTQIVATVAANAKSGTARVQQSGVWSSPMTFNVTTPNISTVSPGRVCPVPS